MALIVLVWLPCCQFQILFNFNCLYVSKLGQFILCYQIRFRIAPSLKPMPCFNCTVIQYTQPIFVHCSNPERKPSLCPRTNLTAFPTTAHHLFPLHKPAAELNLHPGKNPPASQPPNAIYFSYTNAQKKSALYPGANAPRLK